MEDGVKFRRAEHFLDPVDERNAGGVIISVEPSPILQLCWASDGVDALEFDLEGEFVDVEDALRTVDLSHSCGKGLLERGLKFLSF
jgi:hypothetical protein